MRTSWIVIATAVLGSGIGLGMTWLELVRYGDHFEASYADHGRGTGEEPPAPVAYVEGRGTYDFGTLERNQTGTCTFKITNRSVTPLLVDLEGVSCGLCIQTELEQTEIPSSESLEFEVTYTTHKEGPQFSEYVEARTSDPNKPVIRFKITGYVTSSMRFSKRTIDMGSVSAAMDAETKFRIFGFKEGPIEITDHEFHPELETSYFTLETRPLELDDFKDDEPRATSAVEATLHMAGGKPLGPVKQGLRIFAKMGEETTEAEIMINANVVSDIVLIGGSDFEKEKNLIKFRSLPRNVGRSTTLQIRVRGPYRDKIELTVGKIDPEGVLTATLGEPTLLGNGALYPLKINVVKDAPSMNRLGSAQGKVGVINIETTHPSAKLLPIYVSFAIE